MASARRGRVRSCVWTKLDRMWRLVGTCFCRKRGMFANFKPISSCVVGWLWGNRLFLPQIQPLFWTGSLMVPCFFIEFFQFIAFIFQIQNSGPLLIATFYFLHVPFPKNNLWSLWSINLVWRRRNNEGEGKPTSICQKAKMILAFQFPDKRPKIYIFGPDLTGITVFCYKSIFLALVWMGSNPFIAFFLPVLSWVQF